MDSGIWPNQDIYPHCSVRMLEHFRNMRQHNFNAKQLSIIDLIYPRRYTTYIYIYISLTPSSTSECNLCWPGPGSGPKSAIRGARGTFIVHGFNDIFFPKTRLEGSHKPIWCIAWPLFWLALAGAALVPA